MEISSYYFLIIVLVFENLLFSCAQFQGESLFISEGSVICLLTKIMIIFG